MSRFRESLWVLKGGTARAVLFAGAVAFVAAPGHGFSATLLGS